MWRVPTEVFTKMTATGLEGITIPHQAKVTLHLTDELISRKEGVHLNMTIALESWQTFVLSVDYQLVVADLCCHVHQERILPHRKRTRIDNLQRGMLFGCSRLGVREIIVQS